MDPKYDHTKVESRIYKMWESGGYFKPNKKASKAFTIIMPPPNANDNLHIGHARFIAVEDILIRYHRMKGEAALWLPGADHAGIETQYVFEKKLKAEGKSRFDFDRDTLYQMLWDYVQLNKSNMENQLRALGASCDWTRNKFTLDKEIIKIVYQTFKKLYDDGLVYKGEKLVNYCVHCGTGYSELEVDHVERIDPLYYVRYPKVSGGFITIATTRPEPIWADTHLAVNPKDKKNKDLVGTKVLNPLTGEIMEIIADTFVDPEFGTGIVKLTPAHDFNDFDVAQKHHLPIVHAITQSGKITESGGRYSGLKIKEAREQVIADLKEKGLIEKIDENYKHVVGICYRCKSTIEPLPLHQWFLKVTPLVEIAKTAVKKGQTKFAAKRFEKIYFHWLDNLRDWNISRQIVWGIRIPVWYCAGCGKTLVSDTKPKKCIYCPVTQFDQETDTFDTWFSSGQWPFATLKTTKPGDFEKFYPTSVMETGSDILPFWVMRMMMLGLYVTGKVPFKDVLIHGLVRDKEGQKISKSKGNVIDPLVMSNQYGADSLRMAIIWGALVENDISLSEDKVRGQRNFANKLWNIARFITTMTVGPKASATQSKIPADVQILKELSILVDRITKDLESFRLAHAAELLHEFIWHEFANNYLEQEKTRFKNGEENGIATLNNVFEICLKLLHPFMPFVTEEIWGLLGNKTPLIITPWPGPKASKT